MNLENLGLNEKERMTPYQIRLELLKLADGILNQNCDKQAQEIFWTAEKANLVTVKLPKYTAEDVVNTAKLMNDFVSDVARTK